MNTLEKEKALTLLQLMFGGQVDVALEEDTVPHSGIIEDSINAKVSLAGRVVSLALLKVKNNSMASLGDLVLMAAGMSKKHRHPIVWADELTDVKQDYLRKENIPFLDEAGNAWLSNEFVHVDIRGRKVPRKVGATVHRANAFSDKATIVIRILLDSGQMGIREISRIAADAGFSLTPGYVSKMVSALEEQGYAVKDSKSLVSLRRKRELLEDWVYAYKKLSPVQTKKFHLAVPDSDELVQKTAQATQGHAVLSALAAASLIDPFASFDSVLLLAKDFDAAALSLMAAGAREVDRGANIELIHPRYKVSAFWDERVVRNCAVASDLQVYLDLSKQPRRGLEAAEHLYVRKLEVIFSEGEELA